MTALRVNLILLALMLLVAQGIVLWVMHPELQTLILDKELDALALTFSPTGGLVWCARRLAGDQPPCPRCGHNAEALE